MRHHLSRLERALLSFAKLIRLAACDDWSDESHPQASTDFIGSGSLMTIAVQ